MVASMTEVSIGGFASAGEYFSSIRSDSWKCHCCATTAASTLDGRPPVTCLADWGGCGRSRDDEANYTYFTPVGWSETKVQSAIDSFTQPGQRLFNEVVWNFQRHFYLKEPWQYRILALYVLQCKVATGLPAVFYIRIRRTKRLGKTLLHAHISPLARGHNYSHLSNPALPRK